MTEHAIALTDVSRTYRGGAGVQQVDLSVRRGEIHALVGLNGAGKSTLMKLMVGMLRPTSGRIELLGESIADADDAAVAAAAVMAALMTGLLRWASTGDGARLSAAIERSLDVLESP